MAVSWAVAIKEIAMADRGNSNVYFRADQFYLSLRGPSGWHHGLIISIPLSAREPIGPTLHVGCIGDMW